MPDFPPAEALAAWLPQRRWFQGKARSIDRVFVVDRAVLSERLADVFAEVRYADAAVERYQIPMLAGENVADALADPESCQLLAKLATGDTAVGTDAGAQILGRPVTGQKPGANDRVRLLSVEQSNSSVVFGDRFILKLLRRLESGVHPDVEVTRALTEAGFAHVPAQHGAVELVTDEGPVALAVLADFVRGREGWALATAETRDVALGQTPADAVSEYLEALGEVVAGLHIGLEQAFGAEPTDDQVVDGWRQAMQDQLERVLALAERRASAEARPALERSAELQAAVRRLTGGGRRIRIHGDLHLGQTLLDSAGRWQLLDFEGEPAKTIDQRREFTSPMRDVAGMLRSFDYAAAAGALAANGYRDNAHSVPGPLDAWREDAQERFLTGYRHASGADVSELAVWELDKAIYELGYELANRPAWVPIPVAGIVRVLDGLSAGRQT